MSVFSRVLSGNARGIQLHRTYLFRGKLAACEIVTARVETPVGQSVVQTNKVLKLRECVLQVSRSILPRLPWHGISPEEPAGSLSHTCLRWNRASISCCCCAVRCCAMVAGGATAPESMPSTRRSGSASSGWALCCKRCADNARQSAPILTSERVGGGTGSIQSGTRSACASAETTHSREVPRRPLWSLSQQA